MDLDEKVKKSIMRLESFCPSEGYYLAFSGGKDSVVLKALADMAHVKYDAHYRLTSVDPPELVTFIRRQHEDVSIDKPTYSDGSVITMWNLIPRKLMPPTRLVRYCCNQLKESGGKGRLTLTGVRWAESSSRAAHKGVSNIDTSSRELLKLGQDLGYKTHRYGLILNSDNGDARHMVENCYQKSKVVVNPIIDWSDRDIWDFINRQRIPYCQLYDEGFSRLGCIGCPMAGKRGRQREFLRWPTYKRMYLFAFDQMLHARRNRDLPCAGHLCDAQSVFNWWMEYDVIPGQLSIFDNKTESEY